MRLDVLISCTVSSHPIKVVFLVGEDGDVYYRDELYQNVQHRDTDEAPVVIQDSRFGGVCGFLELTFWYYQRSARQTPEE